MCKFCLGSPVENEIHLLLDSSVYKNVRDNLFLEISETEEIVLSYSNCFKNLRILFAQDSLKWLNLLEDYICKAIKKRETTLKNQKQPPIVSKVILLRLSMGYAPDIIACFFFFFKLLLLLLFTRKNIFACLLSVHITISFSRHEQVCSKFVWI